jgi:adenylylsulfate kinase
MYRYSHDIAASEVTRVPEHRNVVQHHGRLTLEQRQRLLNQRPATIWLTGLSGAGKSTLAYELEYSLHTLGFSSFVLDGDNLRHKLSSDLGFSPAERTENIRRTAEVATLMNAAGLIVFTALISPHRSDRSLARSIIGESMFIEVHVNTPLDVCEERDPKGLYKKARTGLIPNFTGISAPYEPPLSPDFCIDTGKLNLRDAATVVLNFLRQRDLLGKC